MRWVLLDLLLAVLALAALGWLALRVWRNLRGLAHELGRAGDLLAGATETLAQLQPDPSSRVPPGPSTAATPPVRPPRRR